MTPALKWKRNEPFHLPSGKGAQHKGLEHDLVCQQDRFPIVTVWSWMCFCAFVLWEHCKPCACCTNIENLCEPMTGITLLSRSPPCMKSNLITLPLQKKFSVFYQRRKSISPSPLSSLSFLSVSRAAPLLGCCTSNSSNYCYGSDVEKEREGGRLSWLFPA